MLNLEFPIVILRSNSWQLLISFDQLPDFLNLDNNTLTFCNLHYLDFGNQFIFSYIKNVLMIWFYWGKLKLRNS